MPKSLPTPTHIRIDIQEERSGIPALLADMPQVKAESVQLEVGDYDVGGDPRRVIERKSASDLVLSIEDGRLFEQLNALLKSSFAPILLLEGDPHSVRSSRCAPKPYEARSATSPLSSVCRFSPAADQRTPLPS